MIGISKIHLYVNTLKHLKPSQVFYRVWRKVGGKTPLKVCYIPNPDVTRADIGRVPTLRELDFDPVFLARFDADALLNDRIELLHHEEHIDWDTDWHEELSSPLWRFNLHYFEYLLSLAEAYRRNKRDAYLDKAKDIIMAWITACSQARGGVAWDPYTISMRVVNWLSFYGELRSELEEDTDFMKVFNTSLAEQFVFLSSYLEVDLLANHYLENLKALTILACYFHDDETLRIVYPELINQVKEQVLPDGMHFELSPMYHKIVLEDLMRVVAALQVVGQDEKVCDLFRLQDMCDCLYSLERNTKRTPLFNDCGDNVAKSCDALLLCAKNHFDIIPTFKAVFPDAGYCVLERETKAGLVKVIFDTGNPGPGYAMGHVHCDALSFECFINGEPWIVNCGTYAYQGELRLEYKKTLSHSTVMVNEKEQHECGAPFRIARFGRGKLTAIEDTRASAIFCFQSGETVERTIDLTDNLLKVSDFTEKSYLVQSSFIFANSPYALEDKCDEVKLSEDFGKEETAFRWINQGMGSIVSSFLFSR